MTKKRNILHHIAGISFKPLQGFANAIGIIIYVSQVWIDTGTLKLNESKIISSSYIDKEIYISNSFSCRLEIRFPQCNFFAWLTIHYCNFYMMHSWRYGYSYEHKMSEVLVRFVPTASVPLQLSKCVKRQQFFPSIMSNNICISSPNQIKS